MFSSRDIGCEEAGGLEREQWWPLLKGASEATWCEIPKSRWCRLQGGSSLCCQRSSGSVHLRGVAGQHTSTLDVFLALRAQLKARPSRAPGPLESAPHHSEAGHPLWIIYAQLPAASPPACHHPVWVWKQPSEGAAGTGAGKPQSSFQVLLTIGSGFERGGWNPGSNTGRKRACSLLSVGALPEPPHSCAHLLLNSREVIDRVWSKGHGPSPSSGSSVGPLWAASTRQPSSRNSYRNRGGLGSLTLKGLHWTGLTGTKPAP